MTLPKIQYLRIIIPAVVVFLAVLGYFLFRSDSPERMLLGTWRSIEDPNFTREFKRDMTVVDRYESTDFTSAGTWSLSAEGEPQLILSFDESPLYFSITTLTRTELELVYREGGILRFEK